MSETLPGVTVSVPATSANLGPGFDAFGLALELRDEVEVTVADEARDAAPASVTVTGEGAGEVPLDGSHLIVSTMRSVAEGAGRTLPAVSLRCTNRIPHGRGLGSSAAATVAGVLAARALLGLDLDDEAVLQVASDIEGHPDNAAACLLGGVTVAWTESSRVRALRLTPATALTATVFVPETRLATSQARGLLPQAIPFTDAVHNTARSALLTAALTTAPHLLFPATEDRLHQDYRASGMPESLELVRRLRAGGAAAVVSGAGPSVLVLSEGSFDAVTDPLRGWRRLHISVASSGASVTQHTAEVLRSVSHQ